MTEPVIWAEACVLQWVSSCDLHIILSSKWTFRFFCCSLVSASLRAGYGRAILDITFYYLFILQGQYWNENINMIQYCRRQWGGHMPVLPFAVGGTVQCSEFLLSFRLQVGQSELQITLKPLCVFTQQCTDTELCSITNEQTPSVRVSRISEPCNKLLMCHSK